MTAVALASRAGKKPDEEGDVFLKNATNAALNAVLKQKLLKEKKAQRRRVTLDAIDEKKNSGK
jgi:hypothetical protein